MKKLTREEKSLGEQRGPRVDVALASPHTGVHEPDDTDISLGYFAQQASPCEPETCAHYI